MAAIPGAYTATNVLKNAPIAQNVGPPGPPGPAGPPGEAGSVGPTYFLVAFNQTNEFNTPLASGAFLFDASQSAFTGKSIYFEATGYVSTAGLTMTVVLKNLTDNLTVTTISGQFDSLIPVTVTSSALTLDGAKIYEVQISLDSGTGSCTLSSAYLKVV